MTECLCPAAVAAATRSLFTGAEPLVLPCNHYVEDDEDFCACCLQGICGANRYVDEDGVLVYEHTVILPTVRWLHVLTTFGLLSYSMN